MRILFLGDDNPLCTSSHRANAMARLGHEVTVFNPRAALPNSRIIAGLGVRVGFLPFVPIVNLRLRHLIGSGRYDIAWVDGGAELNSYFYRWLRGRVTSIINYNNDDPFGGRDGKKWSLYLQAVPHHDLTVVVRNENVVEAQRFGAKKVLRVFMSYDPVAHASLSLTHNERVYWASDVLFVGSWMPERGPLMVELLRSGLPLTIRGDRWEKAPEFRELRGAYRGPGVYGNDYVKAIQCAKVALGLLSIGNRDLHTQRSLEIPFIGSAAFCGQRTSEHLEMLREGIEASYWSTAQECSSACKHLLANESLTKKMVSAARQRVTSLRLDNDSVIEHVLANLVP
jgi:spore maturation protein CgeB